MSSTLEVDCIAHQQYYSKVECFGCYCGDHQSSHRDIVHDNLVDLPPEVLALICKYLVSDKIDSSMANIIIPLLHINKTLREKIYHNWFIWYDKIADIHHFVKSYMPETYSATCLAVICDEKYRNIDLAVKRYDGSSSFYYSSEPYLTEQFVSLMRTICDVSMIQNLAIPIPLLSQKKGEGLQRRLASWINHFPKVTNITFLSPRDTVENGTLKDLSNFIQDMDYYGMPAKTNELTRFETLRDLKISGTMLNFQNIITSHSHELQHFSALSSFITAKQDEISQLSTILPSSQQLRKIELEGALDVSNPTVYNSLHSLSFQLTRLNLEISIPVLMSDIWKSLCTSLVSLKKLTLYIYSREEENENNTMIFSPTKIPLPQNIHHLGLNNFVDVPVHVILDGAHLPFLTFVHIYKLQLLVTTSQKPFPILETFEYFPEKRDEDENTLLDFWITKHSSLLNFSYSYDWDSGDVLFQQITIKNHPSLRKLKIACSNTDVLIDRAPQYTTIIGTPNSLTINGGYVKKLTFNFPNEGKIMYGLRTYHLNFERVDLFVVKLESKAAISIVNFNATIQRLEKMHIFFNLKLINIPEHDISPYIPINASDLSLQEMKLHFLDQIPPSVVDGLSENIHRFKEIKSLSVNFEWIKTGLRGFTNDVGNLNVFNFFNVKAYLTKDTTNLRCISNSYLREMRVDSNDLGDFTIINDCTSLMQLHCHSADKYTPPSNPVIERKVILNSKTSSVVEEIKMSYATPVIYNNLTLQNLNNLHLTDHLFEEFILDLHSLPSLKKLELSKIRGTLKLKQSSHKSHQAIQHINIDSVHTLGLDLSMVSPNLRSLTLTKIANSIESPLLELVHVPKLLKKIIHVPNYKI